MLSSYSTSFDRAYRKATYHLSDFVGIAAFAENASNNAAFYVNVESVTIDRQVYW
jgi:hypothetical protein